MTRISKVVKEPQSEAMTHGNDTHKALELNIRDGTPLPAKYDRYIPIVEAVKATPGVKQAETKFGLTRDLKPTEFFAADVWVRGVLDLTILRDKSAVVLDWKGLAVDTPLPTPGGWTTMGGVQVGDKLYGADGNPCTVVGKSQIKSIPCYRIVFDDTTSVVCDAEHLWEINGEVVSTVDLARAVFGGRQRDKRVRLCQPLQGGGKLPIHPYVLGVWLADGKTSSSEVTKPDVLLWEKIQGFGYALGRDTGRTCPTRTVKGIRAHLRAMSLHLGKHVPPAYLRASVEARTWLLRGLMDGDGNANPARKQAVFTGCNERLVDGVYELLCSLGQRPLKSTVQSTGFGRTVTAHVLSFRPQGGLNPFWLPRKADRIDPAWGPGHSGRRLVASVTPVETVPTQCVSVDSLDSTYLCTRAMLVTHNTGKPKTDPSQLELFAAVTMAVYPQFDTVHTGYVWLAHNRLDTKSFTREDALPIWKGFETRVSRMELASRDDWYPPKPSGLCRAWCPVPRNLCEFSGKQ